MPLKFLSGASRLCLLLQALQHLVVPDYLVVSAQQHSYTTRVLSSVSATSGSYQRLRANRPLSPQQEEDLLLLQQQHQQSRSLLESLGGSPTLSNGTSITGAENTTQNETSDDLTNEDTVESQAIAGIATNVLPTFALVPKRMDNPFFDVSGEGCKKEAERLGVNCLYIGPDLTSGVLPESAQAALILELLANRTELNLQGIAISVVDALAIQPIVDKAINDYKIPIITFDSDAPKSRRLSYVGTDNYFFGTQLAKVLKRVHPQPGRFAIVSALPPNIEEREKGVRDLLVTEGWEEVSDSPSNMNFSSTLVVDQMFAFAETHPDLTAIIPVMGAGMRAADYWVNFTKAHPEILLVVGDAMANQLELLDRQQAHGLVGQLPFEMGLLSLQKLYAMYDTTNYTESMSPDDEFIGTNVLEHLLVPLILPENEVNHNLVGELRYVGYTLFAIVASMVIGFSIWTYANRNARVVKAAQPVFLIALAAGTFFMASAVVPLGFDDTTHAPTEHHNVAICMSPFWLLAFGFSLTFSSLFAKIYRVKVLFESASRFSRAKSSELEAILIPLSGLMIANGVILTCWTVFDPMTYVRLEHTGRDGWDRAVSTYGTCQGDNAMAYLIPLTIVNGTMLIFANWIAYKARGIEEEFAESKYVGIAMMSMLQAFVSGIPILLITRESPQAYYMVQVFMVFITCSGILVLMFVPKIVMFEQFKNQPAAAQRARMQQSIRRSSVSGLKVSSAGFTPSTRSLGPDKSEQFPTLSMQDQSRNAAPSDLDISDLDIPDIKVFDDNETGNGAVTP